MEVSNKITTLDVIDLLQAINPSITKIDRNENLFDAHVLDSYNLIKFVLNLEKKYDIVFEFEDYEMKNFKTIKNIEELLRSKYSFIIES